MAQHWSLAYVASLSAAELDAWEAYDAVYGLPDPNLYQANICDIVNQVMGGAKTSQLHSFEIRPLQPGESSPNRELTPEQTAGVLSRSLTPPGGRIER